MKRKGLEGMLHGPLRAAVVGTLLALALTGCRQECTVDSECGAGGLCNANRCVPPVDTKETYAVYGLKDRRTIHSLGTWPNLSLAEPALGDTVAPEHREQTVSPGGYLVSNGTHLLAGYSLPDWSGHIAVVPMRAGEAPFYLQANGNYTAAALPGLFLINGLGLGTHEVGEAIYGLDTRSTPFRQSVVATPGAGVGLAFSSATALTTSGVAAFGYWADKDKKDVLHAVAKEQILAALELRTPVDLSTAPVIYQGQDLRSAGTFGAGVALLRGLYLKDYSVNHQDVARVALSAPASSGQPVTVGPVVTVLRFRDGCTRVLFLSHMGEDLLLGLKDRSGQRLVRLRAGEGASGEDKGSSTAEVDCATVAHDAALGTLELKAGFSVVESAALPEGVSRVTAVRSEH